MTWYDNGMPVIDDPDVLATTELIRRLYAMPGGGLGGRLHVVLDDGNYEDEQINSGYYRTEDGRTLETYLCQSEFVTEVGWKHRDELCCTPEMADLCRLILASFRRMPEPWRAAAIAWFDGRIARKFPELVVANPPRPPTPEELEVFIAELRQGIARGDAPPEPKPCTPVPCPPLVETDFSHDFEATPLLRAVLSSPRINDISELEALRGNPDWEREQRVLRAQLDQALKLPESIRDLPLSGDWSPTLAAAALPGLPEQLANAPQWQKDAWAKAPDVLRKMLLTGEARLIQFHHETPQVDVEQILLEDAGRPPKVLYRGGPAGTRIHEMLERWLADPKWYPDNAPMIVGVPEGMDAAQLTSAIALCQQAGLLPMTGILLMPAELEG